MSLVGTQVGHIRIIAHLESGGMGEVYIGVDEALGRKVAVKTVARHLSFNSQVRARALREAQILSQLDHPNICRIYDYVEGETNDFLVLELVEGTNLRDLIAGGIELPLALRLAEQLADALTAAHAKGVVHRDLKPANVMVTADRDAKVLDFGLARLREDVVDDVDPPERTPSVEEDARQEPGSEVSSHASNSLSELGGIQGTIAYMSPEQARGEAATAASDMYAFGLLLQEMTTGEPPYEAKLKGRELLINVAEGKTTAPAGIDADLAALIVRLKSLAPEARPSAKEVEERLQWIRGKPARRLRMVLAAMAIVVVLLAGVKYTLDLRRERQLAVEARDQAERLVEFMLEDLYDGLHRQGRLDLLDKVAQQALSYYDSLPRERVVRDKLHRRGLAFRRVGLVLEAQGELEAARAAYESSLGLAQLLVADQPDNAEWLYGLQETHNHLGDVYEVSGAYARALRSFERAVVIGEQALSVDSQLLDSQLELIWSHIRIGDVHESVGRQEEALGAFDRALILARELVRGNHDSPDARQVLSEAYDRRGRALAIRGDAEGAVEAFRSALAICEELAREDPGNVEWQAGMSMILDYYGEVLQDQGELQQALELYLRALEIDRSLSAREPTHLEWRNNLAWAHVRLGFLHSSLGQQQEARSDWREALRVLGEVGDDCPDLYVLDTRVKALLALGRIAEATPGVRRLIERGWENPQLMQLVERHGLDVGTESTQAMPGG
jgi:tetratricopeptide (TPR) repeat protein/tRNA A-37 threonylcarbamoyl transferase component Bud32